MSTNMSIELNIFCGLLNMYSSFFGDNKRHRNRIISCIVVKALAIAHGKTIFFALAPHHICMAQLKVRVAFAIARCAVARGEV